jgi:hypothetical protein
MPQQEIDASYSVENPPRQGRKAATVRDRGLSALPSSAPTGVNRRFAFFTSSSFIPRFYVDFLVLDLLLGTPAAWEQT